MSDNFEKEIQCPICLEIFENEIYQCKNGHSICGDCSEDLHACPECRVSYETSKVRNRTLEGLLEKMKFDCVNKYRGCTAKMARREVAKHEISCTFGKSNIELCNLMGLSCGHILKINDIPSSLIHFSDAHDLHISKQNVIDISLEGFSNFGSSQKLIWSPVILNLENKYNAQLLIIPILIGPGHAISMICIQLNKTNNQLIEDDLRVEFAIKAEDSKKIPDILWIAPPIGIDHAAEAIQHPLFQIKIDHLVKKYVNDKSLLIRCSVGRNTFMKPEDQIIEKISAIYIKNETISTNSGNSPTAPPPSPPENGRRSRRGSSPLPSSSSSKRNSRPRPSINVPDSFPPSEHRLRSKRKEFKKVNCSVCGNMPVSVFYKCLQCASYELCKSCFQKQEHQYHIFALISNKKQIKLLERSIKETKVLKSFFQKYMVLPEGATELPTDALLCTFCGDVNNGLAKYVCLQCRQSFRFCETCFGNLSSTHDKDHSFAVADTETKLKLIMEYLK